MSGLEFMVAQEPAETAPNTGTGVWVIRKQTRKKRLPEEDEITVHSSYFVVGENIYMAPTVGDVIGSRLVCAAFPPCPALCATNNLALYSLEHEQIHLYSL